MSDSTTTKWYENSYRRHLCDMHIDDWHEDFLRDFSVQEYFENLKTAQITSPMIYLQSHIGHCYWPTKTGHMHRAFEGREDTIRRLIELCRKNGMSVVGYYSPAFNTVEADRHKEWQMVLQNGLSQRESTGSRYGLLCPNNTDARNFILAQIEEIAGYFQVDGMFYDMPFWSHPCYCPACRARWEKEYGGELPLEQRDPRWLLFEQKRIEWMGEFAQLITAETRKRMPGVSVEWNYAMAALHESLGNAEPVNAACDYIGGDLYETSMAQIFACLFYGSVTQNQPFEFMVGRCDPNLGSHTLSKTEDRLKSMVMRTAAHHGASLVIDAIDPAGSMDHRVYERIGKVYEAFRQYEPYFKGQLQADVGIYYALGSKFNGQGQSFDNYTGSFNSVRTLVERHVPVNIVGMENLDRLSEYRFLILSNPYSLPENVTGKFIEYVENGGTLYFSNVDDGGLFDTLIGGRLLGYTESDHTYVAPTKEFDQMMMGYHKKYPLPFPGVRLPMVENVGGEIAAHVVLPYTNPKEFKFASIHANPPGIQTEYPALVIRKYKKGTVIWSAAPIENEKYYDYGEIMINLIRMYGIKEFSYISDAPETVELVRYDTDSGIYINVVTLLDTDRIPIQNSFEIRIKTDCKVQSVRRLPSGEDISFTRNGDYICFTAMPLQFLDVYEISTEV